MKQSLKKTFYGKGILVTGGTGSIGSEIVRKLIQYRPKFIRVYSRDESKHYFLEQELNKVKHGKDIMRYLIGDTRDKERLDRAFQEVDIVFHAAALKHVPYCEYNPFEAIKTNVYGTQNVVDLALVHNVRKVIAVSTDKAVYPNTVMGITKLLMERIIISSQNFIGDTKTRFSVVRFGNVLMSRGSVVPTWIDQIKNGGPVTVTDKHMTRFFMSISDAVDLVFRATSLMKGGEIFVLKMPEHNIYELAKDIIQKHSGGKKIPIIFTGKRDKEKLREQLFTDDEKEFIQNKKDFYIIKPGKNIYSRRREQ